jgi:hypothetical protein
MRAVNLLPERKRLSASIRHRVMLYMSGVPVALIANVVGWLAGASLLSEDVGAGHAEIASIRQQIEQADDQRARLAAHHAELTNERAAREAIAARPVWASLIKRIAIVSVEHGRLDRIAVRPLSADRTRQAPRAGEPEEIGFSVRLSGQAVDAAALTTLLLELEEIGIFDKVSLISSSRIREDINEAAVSFEIRCVVNGGTS